MNGEAADRWRLFLRWETKHLPLLATMLFEATGYVPAWLLAGLMNTIISVGCLMALNDDQLTWHDEWARTAVYPRRAKGAAVAAVPPPLPAAAPAPPLPPPGPALR